MVSSRTSKCLWTCVLTAVPLVSAMAQPPTAGIVRITDRGAKPVQAAAYKSVGEYHAAPGDGGYYGGNDFSQCMCPECQGKKGWKGGKSCEHYCTHSPDHGWSIPGKWPIQRRGVQYNSYYPAAWLGTNGVTLGGDVVYPMVYTPTDTTQLGFYYQHVPFWQPQPNPLPARPIPAQWHMYAPTAYASQFENGYIGFMGKGGPLGYGGDCPVVYDSVDSAPMQQPAVVPAPANVGLPPAPLQESAVPQPIERIGF